MDPAGGRYRAENDWSSAMQRAGDQARGFNLFGLRLITCAMCLPSHACTATAQVLPLHSSVHRSISSNYPLGRTCQIKSPVHGIIAVRNAQNLLYPEGRERRRAAREFTGASPFGFLTTVGSSAPVKKIVCATALIVYFLAAFPRQPDSESERADIQ